MNVLLLPNAKKILPLRFSSSEMPHGTIETNRTCNIICDNCYNVNKDYVKSYQQIIAEIDLLLKKRKLQTLTLMGGEPTLHPEIDRIVAYVKSKKVLCQILTNGVLLLKDNGDGLLHALQVAGIDRVALHVDSGQHSVHEDVEYTRGILFDLLERKKMHFSLSITIDTEENGCVSHLVKRYAKYRYFDGIVGFMASNQVTPKYPEKKLNDEYAAISRTLGIEPTAYIPSNMDNSEIRWLIYYFIINSHTGTIIPVPLGINRMFFRLYRFFVGRFPFMVHIPPKLSGFAGLTIVASEIVFSPRNARRYLRWINWQSFLFSTRFHFIAFQVPPETNDSSKPIELCLHCPDATIRNGLLMPLCLADYISPLKYGSVDISCMDPRYKEILRHLNDN